MFTDFLKQEYADENMMFWQACENLKSEKDKEKVVEKVKIIFDDFISILSPKEVRSFFSLYLNRNAPF